MKRFVLLIALFAGCAVQMQVNGKSTYQSNNVLASLTDPTHPPVLVDIDSGFSPNPRTFENLEAYVSERLNAYKPDTRAAGCYGWVGHRPSIVFNNTGLSDVTISSQGGGVIYVEFEDGSFSCEWNPNPAVRIENAPAGEMKVWVGLKTTPGKDAKILPHHVTIEDNNRPRDLGWSSLIPNEKLDGAPKEPIVFKGLVPPVANLKRTDRKCEKFQFAHVPVQRFELSRPIADVEVVVTSPHRVAVELIGPIAEDNRDLKGLCLAKSRNKIKRLEPGRYAFRIGALDPEKSPPYHVMFVGPESRRDKLRIVQGMHADLPIELKALKFHTPFFDSHAMQTQPLLAMSAFLSAPKELLVYPKFDLDKVSAKPWSKTAVFPKKDEGLLILYDRVVITSDGLVYELVKYDYVTDAAPKNIIFPGNPRGATGKEELRVLDQIRSRFD